MEKTVSVKTDTDAVKVAVITTQNKIVTDSLEQKPQDSENIQIEEQVQTEALSSSESEIQAQTFSKL